MAARQALGRLLAGYRKAAGLNQYQLAPFTLYGRSTIANVETGRQNVPRDFWERSDRAVNAGGRLLAASEHLDSLVRQQREETARLAETEAASRVAAHEESGTAPCGVLTAGDHEVKAVVARQRGEAIQALQANRSGIIGRGQR